MNEVYQGSLKKQRGFDEMEAAFFPRFCLGWLSAFIPIPTRVRETQGKHLSRAPLFLGEAQLDPFWFRIAAFETG